MEPPARRPDPPPFTVLPMRSGVALTRRGLLHDLGILLRLLREQTARAESEDATASGRLQAARLRRGVECAIEVALLEPRPSRPVDVWSVLRGLRAVLEDLLPPGAHLDLRADGPPASAVVGHDWALLRTVLNLTANAAAAVGADGAVRIALEMPRSTAIPDAARDHHNGSDWVCLRIEDDGPGMSRGELEQALDPVSALHLDQRSGLGLPIVQDLVARLRGVLVVRSAPQRGTEVELLMPAAAASGAG